MLIKDDTLLIYKVPKQYKKEIKYAIFDLDNTLIVTESGNTFSKYRNDWKLKFDNIKKVLMKLVKDRYKIVIISNQKGISNKNIKETDIIQKIIDILKTIGTDAYVFVATYDDIFRKPKTTIVDRYLQYIDKKNSFYCGDGAGRKKTKDQKKIFRIPIISLP